MEEIFGVDTDRIMLGVAVGFLLIVVGVGVLALFNRIILKVGLRNIPRRPAQTALIVVGLMLSTLIISSALGTGDTLNHSIRIAATDGLGEIDEILTASLTTDLSSFDNPTRSSPYFPIETVETLRRDLEGYDRIDGISPFISERAPISNLTSQQNVSRMNIVGVELSDPGVFGQLASEDGTIIDTSRLTGNATFINATGREELDASVGDTLLMYLESGPVELDVIGIVADGGQAGLDATALISIPQAQTFFGHPGQVNSVAISNRGDARSGVDLSDEVTEHLRSLLTDQAVALQLKDLLNQPEVTARLRANAEDLPESRREDALEFADLIEAEELDSKLVSYLGDDALSGQALIALENTTDDPKQLFTAFSLFRNLKVLSVQDIKADLLDLANTLASGIMSIFIIMGLFSMMAGVMLIFLIFVMLAAERKPEMGISRAVGMKRRHLVQAFIYEGLAYDLISAMVGALLGIGVGFAIVSIMASLFAGEGDGFELIVNYRWQSFVISYCLGVVLTFGTVFFSSYRASKLNIVSAIRDLQDEFVSITSESKLRIVLNAVLAPFVSLMQSFGNLRRRRYGRSLIDLFLFLFKVLPPVWVMLIVWAIVKISGGALSKGWLTFVIGCVTTAIGVIVLQQAPFAIGVTIAVIGAGLMLRWLFDRPNWGPAKQTRTTGVSILAISGFWLVVGITNNQPVTISIAALVAVFEIVRQIALSRSTVVTDLESRNAFTLIGLALLLFWGTPFDSLDWIVPELSGSIEMFFVSGICLVIAPVWVIVYNADLITDAITAVFGRFSRLRPALKTAVAYPLSSRLRTGLTLAMLALVIFTLIVMSMLNTAFGDVLSDVDSVTGGWDIRGVVSYNNPVDDLPAQLPTALGEDVDRITAAGGFTTTPVEVRQVGAEKQEWQPYTANGAQKSYLASTGHDFKLIANGYGTTKEEVWAALRDNPNLAVIDAVAVPPRGGGDPFSIGGPQFRVEGVFFDDTEMDPIEIQIREPGEGAITTVKVIGVLDALSDQVGVLILPKSVLDDISPEPLPITTYMFEVDEGADMKSIATRLDSAFFENGLETTVLEEELAELVEQNLGINRLLQGFMASGLLVGIAALGVISLRSVVERRQQIGVLRAIGYRRSMVMASFLIESSFIALLGILLGVGLGTLLSYNLVDSIGENIPGLRFTIPWMQIGTIVAIAYAFSLLTTFLPARQASRIYPAEALRYE